MKIKTSELEGLALDWAVAKAVGHEDVRVNVDWDIVYLVQKYENAPDAALIQDWEPSTTWGQCGPLIEHHRVMIEPLTRIDHPEGGWHAGFKDRIGVLHGPTPLIAACRAIVAAKLGDEVEVPEELV